MSAHLTEYLRQFYAHRLLYLCLLIASIFSLIDIVAADAFKIPLVYGIIYVVFVAVFKTTIITIPLLLMMRNRYLRIPAYILIVFYVLLSLVNIISYGYYSFGISRKLILIAMQTTPRELAGFIPQLVSNIESSVRSPWFWSAVASIALAVWFVRYMTVKAFDIIVTSATAIGLCAFVIFSLSHSSGRTAHFLTLRIMKYSREVHIWNEKFKSMESMRKEPLFLESIHSGHLATNVIVVIGESASREHLSSYGYPLPTSPNLDKITDSVFLYTNAIGSSMSTSGNMERILSFKPDDTTYGDGLDFQNIVSIFEHAGYKTSWLSNQERTGMVSNTSGVMVLDASVIKYIGAENSEDALAVKYDEVLLPELQMSLADTAPHRLIFLHLLGSHVDYVQRYPEKFNRFTPADELSALNRPWLNEKMARTVAEYDNSILYTDYLLGRIREAVDGLDSPSIIIYFSDHGENVFDNSKYNKRDIEFVKVPFVIYANRSYRDANPAIISMLEASVDKKISTANFVHQLLTLTGTSYQLYDATRDPLSPQFQERIRYVDEKPWNYE